MNFQYEKCNCGCDKFTEITTETIEQKGVRVFSNGDRDYDDAEDQETTGEMDFLHLVCEDCGKKYAMGSGPLKSL